MAYTVKLYYDTGFNGINVPLTKSVLNNSGTSNTFPALNINQAGMINNVAIRANWSDVRNADYLSIYDTHEEWIYKINSITMTSEDVAVIGLTLDPWTTIDGINGISEFLDGITVRHHVGTSQDTFGAYVEPDPFLVPSKALEIESGGQAGNIDYGGNTLIEATVDLGAMGTAQDGVEYTAAVTGGTCVVPQVVKLTAGQYTDVHVASGTYRTPVSSYFNPTDNVMDGVQKLRSLGAEGSILNCWKVPNTATYDDGSSHDRVSLITDSFHTVALPNSLPYAFASVQNKRVLYGELCKYIMLSVSTGNTASFNPEDIFDGTESHSPKVKYIADPRPNGSPHFRFEYYLGSNADSAFWQNCIQGLTNPSAPLIYTDKSGSEIDRMNFETKQSILRENGAVQMARSSYGFASDVLGGAASTYSTSSLPAGAWKTISQGALALTDTIRKNIPGPNMMFEPNPWGEYIYSDRKNLERQLNNQLAEEMQEFRLNNEVVAPSVNFPRSETLRDFVGNGVYVYRLKPSASDITKFDKILTMYGYKDTMPASKDLLEKRSKFSFVQIAGPSIKTTDGFHIPLWLRDLVNTQLGVGLRIWKQKPNTSAYTDGSNT